MGSLFLVPRMKRSFLLSCLALTCSAVVDYSGHQVFRARVNTVKQADFLEELRKEYDFWTEVGVGRSVDILCGPHQLDHLTDELLRHGVEFSIMIEDVQKLAEMAPMAKGTKNKYGHSMDWTAYHPIEDMHSYLDYLETTFDFVTTESIGKSYEGSDMRVAKVCKGGCGNKPAMWFDGGIHAREWVSPATATYMLMELVEHDEDHMDLTENLDWYILPVANPDGYLYTQNSDRLWRKTRSPNGGVLHCHGTDANRNWGFHWNDGGASSNPCSDTYMGSEAFSEVENRNVRDFLSANKDLIKFYNNLHSYSQLVLLPWGWTTEKPDNYDDLYAVAQAGADAMYAAGGQQYDVGCIPCLLYPASGGTLDWTLGVAGIPYSYGMELRDTGHYGFLLPPNQIIPTGEEAWAFHLTVAREIVRQFG